MRPLGCWFLGGRGDMCDTEQYDQFIRVLREYHQYRSAVMWALVRREIAQTLAAIQGRDNQ